MIYTNEAYYHLNLYPEFNRYRLFIANYNLPPQLPDTKHDIWQSSKRGRVRGIWTYVDINQLREGVSVDDFKCLNKSLHRLNPHLSLNHNKYIGQDSNRLIRVKSAICRKLIYNSYFICSLIGCFAQ